MWKLIMRVNILECHPFRVVLFLFDFFFLLWCGFECNIAMVIVKTCKSHYAEEYYLKQKNIFFKKWRSLLSMINLKYPVFMTAAYLNTMSHSQTSCTEQCQNCEGGFHPSVHTVCFTAWSRDNRMEGWN